MSVVPVYRLRAAPADPYPRYRFSRDAHPNRNPAPGRPDPDPETRWAVDRAAFYAWSDPIHDHALNDRLIAVCEFYQLDQSGLVRYLYATDPTPPRGWVSRQYVAFWMYPGEADRDGGLVYLYSQPISDGVNYALSLARTLPDWTNESVLGAAAETLPVVVSVRQDVEEHRKYEKKLSKHREEPVTYQGDLITHQGDPITHQGVPGAFHSELDTYQKESDTDHEEPGTQEKRLATHEQEPGRYHWTYTPSTINLSYPSTLQFMQAPRSDWRFRDLEIVNGKEDFDPPIVTDRLVLVKARYANPGRDFKYRLTIDVFDGPDCVVGDPEVVNQTPDRV